MTHCVNSLRYYLWGAAIAAMLIASSAADNFIVKGKISRQMIIPGTNWPALSQSFEVTVSNHFWFIRTVPLDQTGPVVAYETGTDGTNTFKITRGRRRSPESKAKNDDTAVITSSKIPMNGAGNADILWFAFASAEFLHTNTTGRLPRIGIINDLPRAATEEDTIKSSWSLLEGTQGLPREATFVNEGVKRDWDFKKQSIRETKLGPPFENGYIQGIYRVVEVTNTQAGVLPSKFKFERYSAIENAKTETDVSLTATVEAIVEEVANESLRENYLPVLDKATRVADSRVLVSTNAGTAYMTTNDWLSPTAVKATKAYAQQIETEKRRSMRNSWGKIFLRAFLLVTALAIALAAYLTYRTRSYRSK